MPLDANYDNTIQIPNLATKLANSFAAIAASYVVYPITFIVPGVLGVGSNLAQAIPILLDGGKIPSIVSVFSRVKNVPTGDSLIVDVNKNGSTIFSTQANRPAIPAGTFVSSEMVPDDLTLARYDVLSLDVDQVGSANTGEDLCVVVLVKQGVIFP